ncbi:hypothetical protein HY030_00235 [Candidatus Gottesmanbacteria bacterium]|nr:hypothetical protein [Candidatus Gottesmanbacteria bacterium]
MKNFFLIFSLITLISPTSLLAAKKHVKSTTPAAPAATTGGLSVSSVKLRSDRLALLVTFLNLNDLRDVSYSLTYSGSGVDQGVQGSIAPSGQGSTSRELLFGSCSKNVCVYHQNIKNMRLVITAQTTSGKSIVKKYLVKV